MLKIKDIVDLRLLKKYNFNVTENRIWIGKNFNRDKAVIEIEVNVKTRKIKIAGIRDLFGTVEYTLFDLISDGLVEKSED